jgi:biopolymer transport protein ExbD
MAFSLDEDDCDEASMVSTINTTPLVDVMLVLLIIFLITIPVVVHTVPVSLPKERAVLTQTTPRDVTVSVDQKGRIYWSGQLLADDAALAARTREAAAQQPQPEIHIRGDRDGRYESVGRVVVACQRAGIAKVGFITEPPPRGE